MREHPATPTTTVLLGNEVLNEREAFDSFRASLASASIVVADVSDITPLVSLEIGAALASGKPIIYIARSGTDSMGSLGQSAPYIAYEATEPMGILRGRLKTVMEGIV